MAEQKPLPGFSGAKPSPLEREAGVLPLTPHPAPRKSASTASGQTFQSGTPAEVVTETFPLPGGYAVEAVWNPATRVVRIKDAGETLTVPGARLGQYPALLRRLAAWMEALNGA